MAKVLIAKDVNYGSSIASATQNTAVTPDQLRVGALGVYGVQAVDAVTAANSGKSVLLTNSTAGPGAINVSAQAFNGRSIQIAVGTAIDGPSFLGSILVDGIRRVHTALYTAPVKSIVTIGWNGTSGSLNLASPILPHLQAAVGIVYRKQYNNYPERLSYSTGTKVGTTAYDIVRDIADQANMEPVDRIVVAEVLSNGVVTAFAAATTVVNNSASVTSTAHGVVANDFVSLAGTIYKVVSATANTFVIDRVYEGASATIPLATAGTGKVTTAATEWGIRFTAYNFRVYLEAAVQEILQDATITNSAFVYGSGDPVTVAELEKREYAFRGAFDQYCRLWKIPALLVDSSVNYNIISIEYVNNAEDKASGKALGTALDLVYVIVDVGSTFAANENINDFVAILKTFIPATDYTQF